MSKAIHIPIEVLDLFVDQALDARERKVVEGHLSECAECRAHVGVLELSLATLNRLPQFEPAPGFADRVLARMSASRKSSLADLMLDFLDRLVPSTWKGQLVAGSMMVVVLVPVVLIGLWLNKLPASVDVSLGFIAQNGMSVVGDRLAALGVSLASALPVTEIVNWFREQVARFGLYPVIAIGILASAVIDLSIWYLVRKLRTSSMQEKSCTNLFIAA